MNEPAALKPPLSRRTVTIELGHHELHVACAIFAKLSLGEDVRQLARTAGGQRVYRTLVEARERARDPAW